MDGVESGRGRDKVELSLDGRQIASIVVGALVLLGVVFVLGLNIGRQLASKQEEAGRGDALAALDQPVPSPAIPSDALTYHDRLTKDRAPPVEVAPAVPPPAAAAPEPPGKPTYSVQVMATPSRAEADRVVVKLKEYTPRIEETEVAGRGRMYRIRVGAFATKPEADRFLKGFNGKTGSKGLVVASR